MEEPIFSFQCLFGAKHCFGKVFSPGGDRDRPPHAVRLYTLENDAWVLASELELPAGSTRQSARAAAMGELLRLAKERGWGEVEDRTPTSGIWRADGAWLRASWEE